MKTRKQTTKRTAKKTTKTAAVTHVPVRDVPSETPIKVKTPVKRTRPLQFVRKVQGGEELTLSNQIKSVNKAAAKLGVVMTPTPKRPLGTPPKQDPRTTRIQSLTVEVTRLRLDLAAADAQVEELRKRAATAKNQTARIADLEDTLLKREEALKRTRAQADSHKLRLDYLTRTFDCARQTWIGRRVLERAQRRALLEES